MTSARKALRLVAVRVAPILLLLLPTGGNGQTQNAPAGEAQTAAAATLQTLSSFVELRKSLLREIEEVNRELAAAESDVEKKDLKSKLDKLETDLRAVTANFENVAAGRRVRQDAKKETLGG